MALQDDVALEEEFIQKRMSRGTFGKLLVYLKPYRRILYFNLVLTALSVGAQLIGPKLIQVGMDRYLTQIKDFRSASTGILIVSFLYLLNILLGWYLAVAQTKSAIRIGQGAMNDLRLAIFQHIQKLSLNYFDQTHQGRIISRTDSDVEALDKIFTWGATQLLASLLTLVGVLVLMCLYDWKLCLAVSLVLPVLAVATRWFHQTIMRAYRLMRIQNSKVTSALAESITGVRVVQAFARQQTNLVQFEELAGELRNRAVTVARIFHTYMPLVGLISGVATVVVLGYGSHLVLTHQMTVGALAAFILYLTMFFGPIQTMGDLYNGLLSAGASAERIFELLGTQPQIKDRADARPISKIEGEVTFSDVLFRYDTTPVDQWVLAGVSFRAGPGETIALVGATGSGKTTIINLLARFYDPQSGSIRIDGIDLQETTLASLHQQIGIVTQENFLFSGTVMENLKYGRPAASDEQVKRAAEILGSAPMIEKFEKGYETTVKERGGNFSAGERQMLTFTRAMVADPAILILDEATSAVDHRSEKRIQHALEKLFEKRTCFVIAHRLSTIIHADLILVLDSGRIVERGRHDQLLAADGIYSRLYEEFIRS